MLQLLNHPFCRIGLLGLVCMAVGWTIRGTYEDAKHYQRLSNTVRETNALVRETVAVNAGIEQSAADLKTAAADAFRRFEALYRLSAEKNETPSNDAEPSRPVALHVSSQSKTIAVSPLDAELDRDIIRLLNDVRNAGYGHAPGSCNDQGSAPSPD